MTGSLELLLDAIPLDTEDTDPNVLVGPWNLVRWYVFQRCDFLFQGAKLFVLLGSDVVEDLL